MKQGKVIIDGHTVTDAVPMYSFTCTIMLHIFTQGKYEPVLCIICSLSISIDEYCFKHILVATLQSAVFF